jgi:hypothetical protein
MYHLSKLNTAGGNPLTDGILSCLGELVVNKVYCQSRYRPYLQYYGTEDLQGTDCAYTKKDETLNFADSRNNKPIKPYKGGAAFERSPLCFNASDPVFDV